MPFRDFRETGPCGLFRVLQIPFISSQRRGFKDIKLRNPLGFSYIKTC